ncbi:MAG: hypothetical protein JKY11_06025, partial [Alphaproteobacteria bacterium]|nr:hypothetical protein [Alphaproteobacteria bacterium]
SSEIDPDPINVVLELRNEVYAINRHSIEVFDNVGGTGFPFERIEGAQIQRGTIGHRAATVFDNKVAFVGGGRNEPPGVYIGLNGGNQKISTQEIDVVLQGYTENELAEIVVESRTQLTHVWLYIHLPDQVLVYDAEATRVLQTPVWFTLSGGIITKTQYPARSFVWVYDKWLVGDPVTGRISTPVKTVSSHFGDKVKWDFNVTIAYNGGMGAIVHDMELVSLTGETALGDDPVITTEYTIDGVTWSQPETTSAGKQGERAQRIAWRRGGKMSNWRSQRFSGSSDAHISIARLEARLEGLAF